MAVLPDGDWPVARRIGRVLLPPQRTGLPSSGTASEPSRTRVAVSEPASTHPYWKETDRRYYVRIVVGERLTRDRFEAAQHGHGADAATRRQDRVHFRNQFQLDGHSDLWVRRGSCPTRWAFESYPNSLI